MIEYVLASISKSRESIDYLFMFLLTVMAVAAGLLPAAGARRAP